MTDTPTPPAGPDTPDTTTGETPEQRRRRPRDAARKLEVEIRRERVASLLLARVSYREMARLLDVSKSQIGEDVQAIRKQWRARATDQVDRYVTEQIAELDGIFRAWMPLALNPGPIATVGPDGQTQVPAGTDQILNASRAALVVHRAMERYSRLLGLDAPVRHELTGEGGGPVKFTLEEARAEAERALSEFEQRREQQLRAEQQDQGQVGEAADG